MEYLSEKWRRKYEDRLYKTFPKNNGYTSASGKIMFIFRNKNNKDAFMSLDFEDGEFVEFLYGDDIKNAPRDADFKITADYSTWLLLLSLKKDMTKAYNDKEYEIIGNFSKLMGVLKPLMGSILMQGLIRPSGNVLCFGLMSIVAKTVMKKM